MRTAYTLRYVGLNFEWYLVFLLYKPKKVRYSFSKHIPFRTNFLIPLPPREEFRLRPIIINEGRRSPDLNPQPRYWARQRSRARCLRPCYRDICGMPNTKISYYIKQLVFIYFLIKFHVVSHIQRREPSVKTLRSLRIDLLHFTFSSSVYYSYMFT